MESTYDLTTIFQGKFAKDSYYIANDDGIFNVYLGNYKPTEFLTSVKGSTYFLIETKRLLKRISKAGKIYYKVLEQI